MLDPVSITAGVTVLTSALGAAVGKISVDAAVYAIGSGLAGNTAMELAKAACRKAVGSVELLRDHLTRLDPRENHILFHAMVFAYWQSIAQVADQHCKLLNFTRSDGGGPLLDLIDRCRARMNSAKTSAPGTLPEAVWKSAIESAYSDLTALVAQDLKDSTSGSAREGPALLAWKALQAEFPAATETLRFESFFFEKWFYQFTVNFQFEATKDPQVKDLLLLHLFSEISSPNGGEGLKPEAILNAFEQLGSQIQRGLAGVHEAINAMRTEVGEKLESAIGEVKSTRHDLKVDLKDFKALLFGRLVSPENKGREKEPVIIAESLDREILARDNEASELCSALHERETRIVSITAPPGFGKSSVFLLALKKTIAKKEPTGDPLDTELTGVAELNAESEQPTLTALSNLLSRVTGLDAPVFTSEDVANAGRANKKGARAAFFNFLKRAGRIWLVVENAEKLLVETEKNSPADKERVDFCNLLKDWCNYNHNAKLLLLTRHPWHPSPPPPVHRRLMRVENALLNGLPEDAAVHLLHALFKETRFQNAEEPLLRQIARRLHRMPMALQQFAGYLRTNEMGVPKLDQRFIERNDLLRLYHPGQAEEFLLKMIGEHLRLLDQRRLLLLQVVAWAAMPIPQSGLIEVGKEFDLGDIGEVLTELQRSGLLIQSEITKGEELTFHMHGLVREAIGI